MFEQLGLRPHERTGLLHHGDHEVHLGGEVPDTTSIAPYAAFGAFDFLVSAIWLTAAAHERATA